MAENGSGNETSPNDNAAPPSHELKLRCGADKMVLSLTKDSWERCKGSNFAAIASRLPEFTDWDPEGYYMLRCNLDSAILKRVLYFLEHGRHAEPPRPERLDDFFRLRAAFRYFNVSVTIGPAFTTEDGQPNEVLVTEKYVMVQRPKGQVPEGKAPAASTVASFDHTSLEVVDNPVDPRGPFLVPADPDTECVYLDDLCLSLDSKIGALRLRDASGLPTLMARHHLLQGKRLNGALRVFIPGVTVHFGKKHTGLAACTEDVEFQHWWIQLRLTGKKSEGKFLWMMMAWYRPTCWKCIFTKGHYSEAAGMSLFVEISPRSSLWVARQPRSGVSGSVVRYLLTAPVESPDISLFLQGHRKTCKGNGRSKPPGYALSMRDWASVTRPVWKSGYYVMGSCLDGRGAADVWVVESGKSVVVVVRSEDGRVALCQVAPNMIPRPQWQSRNPLAHVVGVWSGKGFSRFYVKRVNVPRARSIEAVLVMKNQFAIYYKTTRTRDEMQLWRVDNELREYPLSSMPIYSEIIGSGHQRQKWANRWDMASSPGDIPADFFGDRPGAIAFLGEDGDNIENATEVWRTQIKKKKYTHPEVRQTHFRCTPPNPQQYEVEVGGNQF